jgi:hypothetical protein
MRYLLSSLIEGYTKAVPFHISGVSFSHCLICQESINRNFNAQLNANLQGVIFAVFT